MTLPAHLPRREGILEPMSDSPISCSRRTFLLATATTAAGAFLAACGSKAAESIAIGDVPVGGAVFAGDIIIAQPTAGQFAAYSRTCPHQGNTIDKIDGGTVTCTAHGSTFDIADGSVVSGVARDPLTRGSATAEDGTVSATL